MPVTIYRTHYPFHNTVYVLCFSLSKEVTEQIDGWEKARDKIVFEEQIATGSFHGKVPVHRAMRRIQHKAHQEGEILPYYGAISASACIYTLQVIAPHCLIHVEHTVLNDQITFEYAASVIVADAATVAQHHKRGFMISEKAYQVFRQWSLWTEEEELTERFAYIFVPTTIGISITVADSRSGEKIEIMDW